MNLARSRFFKAGLAVTAALVTLTGPPGAVMTAAGGDRAPAGSLVLHLDWAVVAPERAHHRNHVNRLDLHLEWDGAAFTAGLASSPWISREARPVETRNLAMRDGRLSGEVSVDWPEPIPKAAQRPPASVYRIEAKAAEDRVTGSYQGTFAGQAVSGPVRGRFEAPARQAPRQHLDLFFAHGLPDMGTMYAGGNRELVAACTVAEGRVQLARMLVGCPTHLVDDFNPVGLTRTGFGPISFNCFRKQDRRTPVNVVCEPRAELTLGPRELAGTLHARVDVAGVETMRKELPSGTYQWRLQGRRIGSFVAGTFARTRDGTDDGQGHFVGFLAPALAPDPANAWYSIAVQGGAAPRGPGPVRLALERRDGRFVGGVAMLPGRDRARHAADAGDLIVRPAGLDGLGAISGSVTVTTAADPEAGTREGERLAIPVDAVILAHGILWGVKPGLVGEIVAPDPKADFKTRWAASTWAGTLAADARVSERAAAEAMAPILDRPPPGEPLLYDVCRLGATWRDGKAPGGYLATIRPPVLAFKPVAGAASYRFTAEGGFSVENAEPWVATAPLWKTMPIDAKPAAPRGITMEAVPGGNAAEGRQTLGVVRRSPFTGPVVKPPADPRDGLLRLARFMQRQPAASLYHHDYIASNYDIHHGSNYTVLPDLAYTAVLSGLLIHRLSPDREEAEGGLAAAEGAGRALFSQRFKPWGLWIGHWGQWYASIEAGQAWLDLYAATGDPVWGEAAKSVAKSFAEMQQPSGSWTWCSVSSGDPGKINALPWSWAPDKYPVSEYREFEASPFLYFFGRARRILNTDEFRRAEDKAYDWVMRRGAKTFYFRNLLMSNHPHMERIFHGPQNATVFARYLLDEAPPERRDAALAARLAAVCEDVFLDWDRRPHDGHTTPFIASNLPPTYHPQGITANLSRLALVWKTLAGRTGDDLLKAKSDALVASLYAAQDPCSGEIGLAGGFVRPPTWYVHLLAEMADHLERMEEMGKAGRR